jgi:hypothetical protein
MAKWPAMLSSKGSQGPCIPRGLSTFLPCAFTAHIDHPIRRMPEAPHPHRTPTVRTDQRVPTWALLVPLPGGQPDPDRDGALDHALPLGSGLVHEALPLGNRLGGLHPSIPDALEPFGPWVLHHPADTPLDPDGVVLHPRGAVGPVMGRAPLASIVIHTPDGERGAEHLCGDVARHTLILGRDVAFVDVRHQAMGRLSATRLHQPVPRLRRERRAYHAPQRPWPRATQQRLGPILQRLPALPLAIQASTRGDQGQRRMVLAMAPRRVEPHDGATLPCLAPALAQAILHAPGATSPQRTQHERRVVREGRAKHRRDRQDDVALDHPLVAHRAHLPAPVVDVDCGAPHTPRRLTTHGDTRGALPTLQTARRARAHRVGIPASEHLGHEASIRGRMVARMGTLKRLPVLRQDLLEDTPGPRGWGRHRVAPRAGVGKVAVPWFSHAASASSTLHRPVSE